MRAVAAVATSLLIAVPGWAANTCEDSPHDTARAALDCATTLTVRGDSNGASRVFLKAYDELVGTGKVYGDTIDNIERFFFEGGDCLLSYAEHTTTDSSRVGAAARAEQFFTTYVEWYSNLSDDQKHLLRNGGRIRLVIRHIGNAFLAQGRESEIPNLYLNTISDPSYFGPDAMSLWEKALNHLYGPPEKAKDLPSVKSEWQDFADFLIRWATTPRMLKDYVRDRQVKHGESIREACS